MLELPMTTVFKRMQAMLPLMAKKGKRKAKGTKTEKLPPRPGDDYHGIQLRVDDSQARLLKLADDAESTGLCPSSKLTHVKGLIMEWRAKYPDDKIISEPNLLPLLCTCQTASVPNVSTIVFTQFKAIGSIIGRVLRAENINFLYYFGDLTQQTKTKAVDAFQNNPEVQVLVSQARHAVYLSTEGAAEY
jgi:hypothetical protein